MEALMNKLENLIDDLNDKHKEFKCLKQDDMWQNGRIEMENRIIKLDDCLTFQYESRIISLKGTW